jgi:hypothetical protein
MSEDKKEEEKVDPELLKKGTWRHDQELSFNRVNQHLVTLKDAMEKAIDFERRKLSKMVGAKDLVRKPKTDGSV